MPQPKQKKIAFLALIFLTTILIALGLFSVYIDNYLDKSQHWTFFGVVIGLFLARFALETLKKLIVLYKFNPESYLDDKQKAHYYFKSKMKKQWFPVYNDRGQLLYALIDVFVYKRMKNTPVHYPDLILKPVFLDDLLKKGVIREQQMYLWNDAVVEPLNFEKYRTVKEWLVDVGYDPLDDVSEQFSAYFKRHPELNFNKYHWSLSLLPFAYAGVFGLTQLGPFSSFSLVFIATLIFIGIKTSKAINDFQKSTPKNTILSEKFLKNFTGYVPYPKFFEYSKLGVAGKSVVFITFVSDKELKRLQNKEQLTAPLNVDILNPPLFQYSPQAEKREQQIQAVFNSPNAPQPLKYMDLEKHFQYYLYKKEMDYLNLNESQKCKLKEHFQNQLNNDKQKDGF